MKIPAVSASLLSLVCMALPAAADIEIVDTVSGPVVTNIDEEVILRSGGRINSLLEGILSNAPRVGITLERGAAIDAGTDGILAFGNLRLRNGGSILGGNSGVVAFGNAEIENIEVIRGGNEAINIFGRGRVSNWGTIRGASDGVVFFQKGSLDNWGKILADVNDAVLIFGDGRVRNWGEIDGGGEGVVFFEKGHLENYGSIVGRSDEGVAMFGEAFVLNRGRIEGPSGGLLLFDRAHVINSGAIVSRFDGALFGFEKLRLWNSGIISSDLAEGLLAFEETWLVNKGTIRSLGGGGESAALFFGDTWAWNFGTFSSRSGMGIRFFGDQSWLMHYGVVSGGRGEPSIQSFSPVFYLGGTGSYRGRVVGGGDNTLVLGLQGVPKEAKAALQRLEGDVSDVVFTFPGWDFSFEEFDRLEIEYLLSFEEVSPEGLEDFGRALDFTDFTEVGPEALLLGGLGQMTGEYGGNDELDEAFETVSGRAQHTLQSDNAFQVTTQRSLELQRYFDRAREWRERGMHGARLSLTPDPSLVHGVAALQGQLYAANTDGRSVVADVIEEPEAGEEAPPPRRRPEPLPEQGPAPTPAPAPAAEEPLWGGFITGLGMFADQDSNSRRADSDWTTAGATLGLDRQIGDDAIVGLLFGYFRTEADVDDFGSELEDDAFSFGPYLSWGDESGWHASAAAYYTYHRYEQERQITVPGLSVEAESDPDGHQFTTYLSGGYDLRLGAEGSQWTLGPYVALQHSLLDVGSYDESSAGAVGLTYDDQIAHSLQTHLGLRLAKEFSGEWGSVVPEVRALWGHEFLDDDRTITTHTIGGVIPTFDVDTVVADRDFALVGFALTGTCAHWKNLHAFASYDARLGQSDYIAHAVNAGLSLNF